MGKAHFCEPSGDKAFCSGGDQKIRGDAGYIDEAKETMRLNVLDFQRQMRTCPKPIIAMVAGYAIGGGHILHLVADLTIAADNAVFGQTGPKVGSFDGGFGASYMARIVDRRKPARFGTYVGSTTRSRRLIWAWSTRLSRWIGWKKRQSSGAARFWQTHPWLFAA